MNHGTSKHVPSAAMQPRIRSMYLRDCWMARGALVCLWATLGFVYFAIPHGFLGSPIGLTLSAAVVLLLLFNTASVLSMLRHYREDRDHIYGIDLHHLDEHHARRRQAAVAPGTRLSEVQP